MGRLYCEQEPDAVTLASLVDEANGCLARLASVDLQRGGDADEIVLSLPGEDGDPEVRRVPREVLQALSQKIQGLERLLYVR